MDRKTFFKSSIGVIVAGVLAKPIIESLQTEKTDAEKMLDGAKAIDNQLESDIIELHKLNMESLMKRVIVEDSDGYHYLNVKTD